MKIHFMLRCHHFSHRYETAICLIILRDIVKLYLMFSNTAVSFHLLTIKLKSIASMFFVYLAVRNIISPYAAK